MNEEEIELMRCLGLEKAAKPQNKVHKHVYKLGETIAHGVRYFGQEQVNKRGGVTAMCICPLCNELWRVELSTIRSGSSQSCCGNGKKRK